MSFDVRRRYYSVENIITMRETHYASGLDHSTVLSHEVDGRHRAQQLLLKTTTLLLYMYLRGKKIEINFYTDCSTRGFSFCVFSGNSVFENVRHGSAGVT